MLLFADRQADMAHPLVVEVRRDVIGVENADATVLQRGQMVVVAVLVECDQKVSLVTCGENLA